VYGKLASIPLKTYADRGIATNQLSWRSILECRRDTWRIVAYARSQSALAIVVARRQPAHFAMEVLSSAPHQFANVPYRRGAPLRPRHCGETQALFAGASSAGQFEAGN